MFSFFKKKQPEPSPADVLQLDDPAFLKTVLRSVEAGPPGAWLMCVVALENLGPIISATQHLAQSGGGAQLPSNLDDFIRFLATSVANHKNDEVSSRRLAWFFQAALIKRANQKLLGNPQYEDDLADIWICLARGCGLLPHALANNQLWSDDEKAWFSHMADASSGISYCLNHVMPKALRKHPKIKAFADTENVFVSFLG